MLWQQSFLLVLCCFFGLGSVVPTLLRRQCDDSPTCFWANYPPCSEQCHINNWPSTTCYASGSLSDACLCPDVAWQTANAQCIGQYCSSELQDAAEIYSTNCMNNGDTLGISEADFISIGQAAASSAATSSATTPASSTMPTSSSTITSAPSSSSPTSSSSSGGGIDSDTRTNIILGTVIPICGLALTGYGIYRAHKDSKARKKKKEQQKQHELQDLQSPSVVS